MKFIYVGFSFSHHKFSQGGYHHLKNYLSYDQLISAQWEKDFIERNTRNLFVRAFRRIYLLFLGQGTPLTVIRCILLALFRRNQLFHFIYAENSYKWLHHFKGKTNRIVCTFHQPAEYFVNNPRWIKTFKHIDKIILVTNKDIEQFEAWTERENVVFIPHGVNTDFYFFNPEVKKDMSVLMVGNWLRDFNLAKAVFAALNRDMPEVKIRIVTPIYNHGYFSDIQCELYEGISDEQLRDFYQRSNVVFFPLIKYTANNAMLEAAACGCQILVATNSETDNSYFDSSLVSFCPGTAEDAINSCTNLLKNDSFKIGKNLSTFVVRSFSWSNVAVMTQKVLEN